MQTASTEQAVSFDSQALLRERLLESRRALQRWRRSNRAFEKHCELVDLTHETVLLHNTDALADLEGMSSKSQLIEAEFTNAVTQLQLATDLLMRARSAVATWQQAAEDARAALQATAVAHKRTTERIDVLVQKVSFHDRVEHWRWQEAKPALASTRSAARQ